MRGGRRRPRRDERRAQRLDALPLDCERCRRAPGQLRRPRFRLRGSRQSRFGVPLGFLSDPRELGLELRDARRGGREPGTEQARRSVRGRCSHLGGLHCPRRGLRRPAGRGGRVRILIELGEQVEERVWGSVGAIGARERGRGQRVPFLSLFLETNEK